ncbi:Lsr2 family protein [Pseudarthrobacter sp. RMG13]|uniref:Lsr2 family protein n=1 Tax=Pseudarthrobacter humi TaxID=2952523 RepID=A0ABT1LVU4_9MICC|nr:Lsr2 family protein [Pseudarthrobacter humi]MCP9002024.1 Lsr2 family protein [Pseudarthrobacter humi]
MDGSEASETIRFTLDGSEYEIASTKPTPRNFALPSPALPTWPGN